MFIYYTMDYYKGIYFINIFKYYIKPFKKNNKQIQCNNKMKIFVLTNILVTQFYRYIGIHQKILVEQKLIKTH